MEITIKNLQLGDTPGAFEAEVYYDETHRELTVSTLSDGTYDWHLTFEVTERGLVLRRHRHGTSDIRSVEDRPETDHGGWLLTEIGGSDE